MRKYLTTLVLLVVAPLALAGCGDEPATAAHNDADVTFAQEMIPHHRQAVEMAALAESRAADPEVRELAADIEAAQEPEIETMTGWLEAWDEDVPAGSMDHGDMGHGSEAMPGMMSAEEMADLEQAEGEHPEALALAEKIEADQKAEIATMQTLLES